MEKEALARSLYNLGGQLFGNLPFERFRSDMIEPDSNKSFLACCYDQEEKIVGFFNLHIHVITLNGKNNLVFRGQTGLLPEYRRKTASLFYMIFLIVYYRFRYPLKPIRCFLVIMNPGMYATLAGILQEMHPSINHKITEADLKLMLELRTAFKLHDEKQPNNWIVKMGLHSLFSSDEDNFYNNSVNPHIKHYIKINPNYQKGYGLLCHIPFTWRNILLSSGSVMKYMIKRSLRQFSSFHKLSIQYR